MTSHHDSMPPRRRFLQLSAGFAALSLFEAGVGFEPRHSVFADEAPLRDGKRLRVLSREPMNAEPAMAELVEAWITPVDRFFVRTHGNTPALDAAAHRLSVEGLVDKPLQLSLSDLGRHKAASATTTLTCAGNRRTEMSAIRPIPGVAWAAGAIGNATWSGVRLRDLLAAAGVKPEAKHVWFESLDVVKKPDGSTTAFGGSIPLDKAMAERDGAATLLATQMNDKPLTIDHGFPVRAVVPGYVGARSVKWLTKIVVSDRPSPNFFMADAYKVVQTNEADESKRADPILVYPVNGAIAVPADSAAVKAGTLKVRGYALPTGVPENPVERVDLSIDGGKQWTAAKIVTPKREFCWSLWEAEIPVTPQTRAVIVRVTDAKGNAQPETPPWNQKGYLFNSWHKASLKVGDA